MCFLNAAVHLVRSASSSGRREGLWEEGVLFVEELCDCSVQPGLGALQGAQAQSELALLFVALSLRSSDARWRCGGVIGAEAVEEHVQLWLVALLEQLVEAARNAHGRVWLARQLG